MFSQQKVNIKKLTADISLKKIFGDPRNFGGSDSSSNAANELYGTIVRNFYFYQMSYIFIFFSVFLEIQILLSGLYFLLLWLLIIWQHEFIVIWILIWKIHWWNDFAAFIKYLTNWFSDLPLMIWSNFDFNAGYLSFGVKCHHLQFPP